MAESEVDTPSTPIEYESKYFEHHGVRLPPFCRGKMDEIANFSLRSSDIWIVTYPKSGRPKEKSLYPVSRAGLAPWSCVGGVRWVSSLPEEANQIQFPFCRGP